MPREDTGSVPLEDRFYNFVTKDFHDFRQEVGGRLTGLETQMTGVNGRLKKIEGNQSFPPPPVNGSKAAFLKWLPWLITTAITGAAMAGAALAGKF